MCDNIINVNSNCKDTFDSLAVGVGQKDCISGCAKTKYDVNNVQCKHFQIAFFFFFFGGGGGGGQTNA